jgi:hypothetical protein
MGALCFAAHPRRINSLLVLYGPTLQVAEKLMFVSGHDFSRAVKGAEMRASAPEVLLSCTGFPPGRKEKTQGLKPS